jgi:methylene-fatty-acyl-phospholipid synthase
VQQSVPIFVAAAALLALERATYAWAWRRPRSFCAAFDRLELRDPVLVLERLFYGFKAIQVAVLAGWCWHLAARTGWPRERATSVYVLGVLAIVAGQVLNLSVFLRLGRVGVFYGNRFGHRVEWRDGFPFSLLAHPQYVGAALTIWGVFLLVRFPFADWFALPLLSSVYYAIGAHLERLPEGEAIAEKG